MSIMEAIMAAHLMNTVPTRAAPHERLEIFVGKWHAEGKSYAAGQTKQNPRGATEKWLSDETFKWLPGQFFLMQRWDAMTGANAFQGTAIISWDDVNQHYMTRSYENHGFVRDYVTRVDGKTWTFTGDSERARVEFTDGGNTQNIAWEWRRPGEDWLPLCDRVAKRAS
jgi:Protein of unknown function (DUF1579)